MNSNAKEIFVFIEPVNHGYKVVLAAKAMGYRIAAIHKLPLYAPPPYEEALEAFDLDIQVDSWLDLKSLHSMVDREFSGYRIVGTYAGAEITLKFNATLRERVGLPTPPAAVIEFLLNKFNVRDTLWRNNLTALRYLSRQQVLDLDQWTFDRPFYFKPCHGGGSAKVFKCESMPDLRRAITSWYNKEDIHLEVLKEYLELKDDFILEEAAEGELVSVEALTCGGRVNVLGITSRSLLARDTVIEMGATFPYNHRFSRQIVAKVIKIHEALGISHGPTHTEVMVSEQGEVELVEMNLRFAGADVLEICCRAYDTNIAENLVRLGAGMEPELPPETPRHYSTVQYILAPHDLRRFKSMEFTTVPEFFRIHKPLDEDLRSTDNQLDHVGCFIMTDDDYERLMENSKTERDSVKINGMMIKDDANNVVILR